MADKEEEDKGSSLTDPEPNPEPDPESDPESVPESDLESDAEPDPQGPDDKAEVHKPDWIDKKLRQLAKIFTDYGKEVPEMNALKLNSELGKVADSGSKKEAKKVSMERLAKLALLLKARLDQEVIVTSGLDDDLKREQRARKAERSAFNVDLQLARAEAAMLQGEVQSLKQSQTNDVAQLKQAEIERLTTSLQEAKETCDALMKCEEHTLKLYEESVRQHQRTREEHETVTRERDELYTQCYELQRVCTEHSAEINEYKEKLASTEYQLLTEKKKRLALINSQNPTPPPRPPTPPPRPPTPLPRSPTPLPRSPTPPPRSPNPPRSPLGPLKPTNPPDAPMGGSDNNPQTPLSMAELRNMAKSIQTFAPGPMGSHETKIYLDDLDFQLQRFPEATVDDRICLLRLTSDRTVHAFMKRQRDAVMKDYSLLCAALLKEYTPCTGPDGIIAAADIKQGRNEHPRSYYDRIFRAYFGDRCEPEMEEEVGFKYIFSKNLCPDIREKVHVSANYKRRSIDEIRECAIDVFTGRTPNKTPFEVCPGEMVKSNSLELEGARKTTPYPTKGEKKQHFRPDKARSEGARWNYDPKWLRPDPEFGKRYQKGGTRPKDKKDGHKSKPYQKGGSQQEPPSQGQAPPTSRTEQSETGKKSQKFQKKGRSPLSPEDMENIRRMFEIWDNTKNDNKPGVMCSTIIDSNSEHTNNNDATIADSHQDTDGQDADNQVNDSQIIDSPEGDSQRNVNCIHDIVVTESENPSSEKGGESSVTNDSGSSQPEHSDPCVSALPVLINEGHTVRGRRDKRRRKPDIFLCDIIRKGPAKKAYLSITLEGVLTKEALLDGGADITIMSPTLLEELRLAANGVDREIPLKECAIALQGLSETSTTLTAIAMVHMQIGETTLYHPVHVSTVDSFPFLVGQDFINRFDAIIDYGDQTMWTRVSQPLPIDMPIQGDTDRLTAGTAEGKRESSDENTIPVSEPSTTSEAEEAQQESPLCELKQSALTEHYLPQVVKGVEIQGSHTDDAVLSPWTEKSAISQAFYGTLVKKQLGLGMNKKAFRFSLDPNDKQVMTAKGIINLKLIWNQRELDHPFLVVPNLPHATYIGSDILVRLGVRVDINNDVLWSLETATRDSPVLTTENLKAGQTIPEVCQVANSHNTVVPPQVMNKPVMIHIMKGQAISTKQAYFQPSPMFFNLGLSMEATCQVTLDCRTTTVAVCNTSTEEVLIPKNTQLGWLISTDFHDFELSIPFLGGLTANLIPSRHTGQVLFTKPTQAIALFSPNESDHDPVNKFGFNQGESLGPQTYSVLPINRVNDTERDSLEHPKEQEPLSISSQIDQVVAQADALKTDEDRDKLRKVLLKYEKSFSTDSMDCGLTTLHTVSIPTPPDAPPAFVRQYKIPLAAHQPIREIINDLLGKGIIRYCNSTYSAPLWPVLKPNGKWRLTIDYRKLNKQVPLSRWPMTQLQQELPKVTNGKYFSTLDVASGFWTIPVRVEDQYKLAFTFGGRQYTFNRCPFGYANSPAEFNIFLNKACPDAHERGTLIYVDDVLLRQPTLDSHLAEIDHVLNQLTTAGAKISLSKCQWCRTKVDYVGLLVGPDGIQPQLTRTQGLDNLKVPTNLKELQSFLGVCNYSNQFIENYADLAKPLTELLKKDVPFVWTDKQQQAMDALINRIKSAPCLVYPDYNKEFYLEVGFSAHCISAGLYQIHDRDKRVVAYASKTMAGPELRFSDCEKALLTTVWAVKHFSSYIGGQRIIVETQHQPVTFLNSERIRDGVVTNSRVATWLMALQSFNLDIRYGQNKKSHLGTDLAICQKCTQDVPATQPLAEVKTPVTEDPNHHFFDDNICRDMTTLYVDGSSFLRDKICRAGVGGVLLQDHEQITFSYKLGSQTSQYAEIAGILIALQMVVARSIKTLVICTDSNYARLSFACHLAVWKQNGFLTSDRKVVKHKELFMACDHLVTSHDLQIYWKKVPGHSRVPGDDKHYNDIADSLAKEGADDGPLWSFDSSWLIKTLSTQPTVEVMAVTRAQAAARPADNAISVRPALTDPDIIQLQKSDPAINSMILYLTDPDKNTLSKDELDSDPDLKVLYQLRKQLKLVKGILTFAHGPTSSPVFVVPHDQRGVMLVHAHDLPSAGHKGDKATLTALKQIAYWPGMKKDVKDYIEGCVVCGQFQPTRPLHRAPLQSRGIAFPWSDLQIDWVGPLTKSSRGNKYFLTVTCAFTKWVECLPAPNDTAQTTAMLLMNHIFSRFGLPLRVNSDQGTHFTGEVMKELWKTLGVKANFHVGYHPQASGQVERANRTVVSILKKYVAANHKDWDVKLPLVLMAIRATPHTSTGISPFEMMTGRQMTLPLHLLYQPGDTAMATAYTTQQYMKDLNVHLRNTFAFAQKNLERSAEGRKAYYDQKASHNELQVGDRVWYYTFAPATGKGESGTGTLARKLMPRWTGPHLITDKVSSVVYEIKISKGRKEPIAKWVHRNQIKPYKAFNDSTKDKDLTNSPTSWDNKVVQTQVSK